MFSIADRVRSKTMRVLAVLSVVLVPGALVLSPGSASAQSPIEFYELDCNPAIFLGPTWTVDDTNTSRIAYSGYWKLEKPMRGQYMGTQHITNVGGSTASFTTPTSPWMFAFGYTKMRNAGKAAIYYNNQYVTTIDMYAPTNQYNCAMYFGYGSTGPGTFIVKALNQKNPVSQGTYVNVDYFHYET
jgi:hypothetical protein